QERRAGLVDAGELPAGWPLPYEATTVLETLSRDALELLDEQDGEDAGYRPAPLLAGRPEQLGRWLADLAGSRQRVVITTDQASRVAELLEEAGRPTGAGAELHERPAPGGIGLVHGSLTGGFVHEPSGLAVLTDRELFG